MGIGLEKRCYLSQDVDKTTIIESLKNKQGKVTELSIVANIENIYYLSKPGDTKMIASIRLISDALTQIGCPDTSKTNHFDFL